MKYRGIFSIISVVCVVNSLFSVKNIIFELDDILFTPHEDTSKIGALVNEATIEHYRSKLFSMVGKVQVGRHEPLPEVYFKEYILPPAWRLYLMNKFSSTEIHAKVDQVIKKEIAWFWPERSILLHATSLAFNPQAEAAIMLPVKKGHSLVYACAQKRDNRLFLFSNKNTETIAALQKRYPEFFKLFGTRVGVSGDLKQLKPAKEAYRAFIDTYKLNPSECYIIEHKPHYLASAKSLGMHGFLCDTNNFGILKKQLKAQNIL